MNKVIKLKHPTGCTATLEEAEQFCNFTHLVSFTNYATLCGIGEEEIEDIEEINGKLTCPDCLKIVEIVKSYLKKNPKNIRNH